MATFGGALVSTGVAVALHVPDDLRSVLPLCVAAFVLYLWVFVSTIAVNVPLNDEIKGCW
jgi:anthrone oxygenase-like protein